MPRHDVRRSMLSSFLRQHPLLVFFVVAYAFSWAMVALISVSFVSRWPPCLACFRRRSGAAVVAGGCRFAVVAIILVSMDGRDRGPKLYGLSWSPARLLSSVPSVVCGEVVVPSASASVHLKEAMGLDLTALDAKALEARTEGWI